MKIEEAIVIKTVPFKERDKILTLYTPSLGKIGAYVRGSRKDPLHWLSPLTEIEGLFTPGKGDLFHTKDLLLTNSLPWIRESIDAIDAASAMTKLILSKEEEKHPNPLLYSLFKKMLYGLNKAPHPFAIATSFYLKRHHLEGEINLENLGEAGEVLLQARSFSTLASIPVDKSIYLAFTQRDLLT